MGLRSPTRRSQTTPDTKELVELVFATRAHYMGMNMENIRMLNALQICVFVVARKKVSARRGGTRSTANRIFAKFKKRRLA